MTAVEKLKEIFEIYEIAHFKPEEFLTNTTDFPNDNQLELIENLIPTLFVIDTLREETGIAIRINDWFRTWESHVAIYNRINAEREAEGKKPLPIPKESLHLFCNAVDFSPVATSSKDLQSKLKVLREWLKAWDYGILIKWKGKDIVVEKEKCGLGLKYKNFIHVDTGAFLGRSLNRTW